MDILIVDDDRDFADSLADVLRLEGHRVAATYSGEEALEKCRAERFALMFFDMRLPGINGVETLQAVQTQQPDARAYMMTGFSGLNLLRQARDMGARGVLNKPLDLDEVLGLVEEEQRQ